MTLRHRDWMSVQARNFVVDGPHGSLDFRCCTGLGNRALAGDSILSLHRYGHWLGCGLDGDPCPGGPSWLSALPVHVGAPVELITDAALLAGLPDEQVWAEMDALYMRVMPGPGAVLIVPAELPPPPDPGLAARLRDTPFGLL